MAAVHTDAHTERKRQRRRHAPHYVKNRRGEEQRPVGVVFAWIWPPDGSDVTVPNSLNLPHIADAFGRKVDGRKEAIEDIHQFADLYASCVCVCVCVCPRALAGRYQYRY